MKNYIHICVKMDIIFSGIGGTPIRGMFAPPCQTDEQSRRRDAPVRAVVQGERL